MSMSLGKKISELRKQRGLTQDELSEQLGVSAQAVSKWENDISCPDIMLLPQLAQILNVSVDELLSNEPPKETFLVPVEKRKNSDDLVLKIIVNSAGGDKVKINIPLSLAKAFSNMGMNISQISNNDSLKNVDLEKIFMLLDNGVLGKLLEVESSDGDIVEIVVE